MIKIAEDLAEELIEWLEIDLDNAFDEDDEERCQRMIDELQEAIDGNGH